jgi:hypothetical protein
MLAARSDEIGMAMHDADPLSRLSQLKMCVPRQAQLTTQRLPSGSTDRIVKAPNLMPMSGALSVMTIPPPL